MFGVGNDAFNAGDTRKDGDNEDEDVVDWGESGEAGGVGDDPTPRSPENFSTLNFKCTQSLPILVLVDFSTVFNFLSLAWSSTVKSSAEMTQKRTNNPS